MTAVFFVAFFVILSLCGMFYQWYQKSNAVLIARAKFDAQQEEMQQGYTDALAHVVSLQQELTRSAMHINFLNQELLALKPVGTLKRRHTRVLRQQEHAQHGTDPDTARLPSVPHKSHFHVYSVADDLPPIQVL